jgi:uncharacterized protein
LADRSGFAERYGPWAIVAGASEGLGAAFAHSVAERGVNLVLVARRVALLDDVATELKSSYAVDVRTVAADLATTEGHDALGDATDGLAVGLVIANAAFAPLGRFTETPLEESLRALDVNCRSPLLLVDRYAGAMVERKRGGIILMSSLSGLQGSPSIAVYSATKAFNIVLAESLWGELADAGVDVLVSCAGAISTPNYQRTFGRRSPGTLTPRDVAETTLAAVGRGPRVVPGRVNRIAAFTMTRLLPRRTAIRLMGRASRPPAPGRAQD